MSNLRLLHVRKLIRNLPDLSSEQCDIKHILEQIVDALDELYRDVDRLYDE